MSVKNCSAFIAIGVALLVGCDTGHDRQTVNSSATGDSSAPVIFATSYPLQWTTQQLVGEFCQVQCPAADMSEPDLWRPDRQTVSKMQTADLIISNGLAAPYAKWMLTSSLPASRVVEAATKGLSLRDFISVADLQLVHSHGPEGEHSHPTMVTRTWLSPRVLLKQASFIKGALTQRFPEHAERFEANFKVLQVKIETDNVLQSSQQAAETPKLACWSATPELKFLTRWAAVDDQHFHWNTKTPTATAVEQLQTRLSAFEQSSSPNSPVLTRAILFPARLEPLAVQLQPWMSQNNFQVIFVDLLDRANEKIDLVARMQNNLVAVGSLRSIASPGQTK